ncbi:ECF sigma factor [Nitrosococcus oceani ATCC 19707]|uniref:ECF sigma factor n=2 Tax=Nitrosococcus oceani TaxID=1229 RepID=Q3JB36_NITOC|nr:sigma-70 family RNA polymerase sigma factor [Nitrosococcus oceani]ABA57960.1 ECF sigma factor [Nitrosococcus oceani ATCC 19707]KFI19689.1 RNA polymerase sigma70 [Nitrosococcus oceani C-27]GEM19606.1 DNA-directed RNA polymerase sigma-70 factor [Nitrosococcus oceani]
MDDTDLIDRVARADPKALGHLYDCYAPLLLAVGLGILSNRQEAEDVLHNVFMEIWRKASQYDGRRGSVRAWLILRMRSRSLDRLRSAPYTRSIPIPETVLENTANGMSQDPALAWDCQAVRKAMSKLSREQRTIMELAYFQGLSASEIASHVGLPLGTIKSRMRGALNVLRTHYRTQCQRISNETEGK